MEHPCNSGYCAVELPKISPAYLSPAMHGGQHKQFFIIFNGILYFVANIEYSLFCTQDFWLNIVIVIFAVRW